MIDAAQFGPGRPINVADQWATAVLKERDLRAAWPLMASELRRRYVRAWLEANTAHPMISGEDPDELCEVLSSDDPGRHRLWSGFALLLVDEFHEKWTHINPHHCGFLTAPRPLDLDRELVLYVDKGTPNPVTIDGPEDGEVELKLPFVGFVMRHGEAGWLIEDFELDGRLAGQPLS